MAICDICAAHATFGYLNAARVLQVLGARPSCVKTMASHNVVSILVRSLLPLHRDAAFTLETLLVILKTGARADPQSSWVLVVIASDARVSM